MSHARHLGRGTLPIATIAFLIGCHDTPASPGTEPDGEAGADDAALADFSQEEGEGPRLPFAELAIFLELNSTDDDLGVQVFLDAEDWNRISASSPDRKRLLDIAAKKELGELGLTELRFESAEPSPGEVLDLFPSGTYRFTGRTVERGRLLGEATLSHDLPPAPVFTPADGDEVDAANTVIAWEAIPGLAGYEVIVESEDTGLSMTVALGPSATSLTVPPELLEPDSEYKAEVLAISPNGNKTITEHTFFTSP